VFYGNSYKKQLVRKTHVFMCGVSCVSWLYTMEYTLKYVLSHLVRIVLPVLLLCTIQAHAYSKPLTDTVAIKNTIKEAVTCMGSEPYRSKQLGLSCLEASGKLSWQPGIARSYRTIALAHMYMGNLKDAVSYCDSALAVCMQYHLRADESRVLYVFSAIYTQSGDYAKAAEYLERALIIYRERADSVALGDAYSSLGVIYTHEKMYEKANSFYEKAITLFRIQKDTVTEAQFTGYIATNYMSMGRIDEAAKLFRASMNLVPLPGIMINLGNLYILKNRDDSAMYYFSSALPMLLADSNMLDVAKTWQSMAEVEMRRGHIDKAETLLLDGLSVVTRLANIENIAEKEQALSRLYAMKKDWEKAYRHHVQAMKFNDSILNQETAQKLAQYAARFELKEIAGYNNELRRTNELQRLHLQQKNIIIYGTVVVALILLLLGVLIFRQQRLRTQQEKTELEQRQLRAQMNPHFIFNSLNSIQHFVVEGDVLNANRYLSGFATLMRQTLEYSARAAITLRQEIAYLENYIALEQMRYEHKFTAAVTCTEDVDQDTAEIPPMTVQPFVENAIRHGLCYLKDKKGHLAVRFYRDADSLVCEVEDNGIGRTRSKEIRAAKGVAYKSHGMELTRRRLELVSRSTGGRYSIHVTDKTPDTHSETGTIITIRFALSL